MIRWHVDKFREFQAASFGGLDRERSRNVSERIFILEAHIQHGNDVDFQPSGIADQPIQHILAATPRLHKSRAAQDLKVTRSIGKVRLAQADSVSTLRSPCATSSRNSNLCAWPSALTIAAKLMKSDCLCPVLGIEPSLRKWSATPL